MERNVRVRLEYSLFIGKGKLAESNADRVSNIKCNGEDLSLQTVTTD